MFLKQISSCAYLGVVQGVSELDEVAVARSVGRVLLLGDGLRAVEVVLDGNDGLGLGENGLVGVADAIANDSEKQQTGEIRRAAYRTVKFKNSVFSWQVQATVLIELATEGSGS